MALFLFWINKYQIKNPADEAGLFVTNKRSTIIVK